MASEPDYPAGPWAWTEGIKSLVGRLPALVSEGHLSASDARVVQHLADQPVATRTAHCPVCVLRDLFGEFQAGTDQAAVRWNTVRDEACRAMIGIDWIAEEPVPMTPTRKPVKSTP